MTDYYHDKLNWRNELLVIASEEASEIVKVVSKILRYGMQPKDQKALIEEIGDMQCMIDLIIENKLITKTEIKDRIKVKRNKLKKWSNLWQMKSKKSNISKSAVSNNNNNYKGIGAGLGAYNKVPTHLRGSKNLRATQEKRSDKRPGRDKVDSSEQNGRESNT